MGRWELEGAPAFRRKRTSGVKKPETQLGQVHHRLKGDGHSPNHGRNNERFNI